jgi:WhiB family redox-sensing transcriptional regulator
MKTQEDLERRTDTTTPSSEESGTKGKGTTMLAPLSEDEFSPEWWDEALCRDGEGGLTKVFFSEELQDIARAKTICAECPAMLTCLEGAIARREPWGVWGGQMFLNGKILATKRRRGRPPKNPRPEDQLPEIPVPLHLQGYLRSA